MCVAALVTGLLGGARAEDDAPAARVRYRDDRMSVDLKRVPLSDVIDELSRQSGAAIRGKTHKPQELSLRFDDVPLPTALERVLGEQSFALRYGPGGQLVAVELMGEPGALQAPLTAAAATGGGASSQPNGSGGGGASRVGPGARSAGLSVSVPGGASTNGQASTLGSPVMVGGGSQQTAAQTQQQQQQAEVNQADLEQRIRHSLLNSLGGMDDASLAAFMDTPEGRRVQALLQYYADHHVGSTRQQQAAGIIDRLGGTPAPGSPAPGSHHTWH